MRKLMNDEPVLNISKSAVDAYRQCQQLYYYRYFQKIKKRGGTRVLELGSLLHKYLEEYYRALKPVGRAKRGLKPRDAHIKAQMMAAAEFTPRIRKSVRDLIALGQRELAAEFNELIPLAGRITDRYYLTHGESDADEFEILMIEDWLNLDILEAEDDLLKVRSNSRLDMLTRQRATGRVHLWENKSAANIPEMSIRLRDLQTTLYAEKLFKLGMIPARVDAVMWNYLRTKEPTVPESLIRGGLSRRADLDSTWEVYSRELDRLRLAHMDYQEQRERLEGREATAFFPRYEQVILADARRLLGDYVQTASDIRDARHAWERKERRPVRTLGPHCDWCEFSRLCNAALLSGTDADARSDYESSEVKRD